MASISNRTNWFLLGNCFERKKLEFSFKRRSNNFSVTLLTFKKDLSRKLSSYRSTSKKCIMQWWNITVTLLGTQHGLYWIISNGKMVMRMFRFLMLNLKHKWNSRITNEDAQFSDSDLE